MSARSETGPSHLALLALLSLIAGLVDVISFLSFDHVFAAHVTGNLVVLVAQLVEGGALHLAPMLSIPVFGLTLAVAYLLARLLSRTRGRGALLVAESLMLFLIVGLAIRTRRGDVRALRDSVLGVLLAVAAMAFQNAFVRVSLHQGSSTTAMTSNVISLVIELVALIWPGPWARDEATTKLRSTWPVLFGFCLGCAVGAASIARLGLWAWVVPALLSLIAIPVGVAAPAAPVARQGLSVSSRTLDRQA